MKNSFLIPFAAAWFAISNCSQTSSKQTGQERVGGNCEGCEAIYESPKPFDKLDHLCWLPDWKEGENTLAVNGIVYNQDGTPAPGVIIYIYHTDQNGIYPTSGNEIGWARRHGYIRGWMKTNEKGEYKFFTRRPAAYPGRKEPAHIHAILKEPGMNEYWIDEYVFDDDPLLTPEMRRRHEDRGGSGILIRPAYYIGKKSMKSERHIYLGKNIPNYPK